MFQKKNILISGWYGHNNAGDELLLDIFLRKNAGHDITVLTGGKISIKRAKSLYHHDVLRFDIGGLKQWLSGKPFSILRALKKCDLFVLGGGGIIRETGSLRNLNRLLDEILIAKLLRKKIFIYGVSIGPITSKKAMEMVKRALHKCDYITVRDFKSMKYLETFGIDKSKYSVIPDPAFIKMKSKKNTLSNTLKNALVIEKRIPIFLALGLISDGKDLSWLDPFANALEKLATCHGVSFIAVPFRRLSDESIDDRYCARELQKRLSTPLILTCFDDELDHDDLREVITLSRCVITVRLHAMIIAITEQTPFVAINYDTKVMDTASIAGLSQQVVALNNDFESNLFTLASSLIKNTEELRTQIDISSTKMSQSAEQTFHRLNKLLTN